MLLQDQAPVESQGGDGKMKMELNLKELAGDPSDETIGAAAVGLMAQAVRYIVTLQQHKTLFILIQVKAKGPDETQVNALTGLSQQIMSTVTPFYY